MNVRYKPSSVSVNNEEKLSFSFIILKMKLGDVMPILVTYYLKGFFRVLSGFKKSAKLYIIFVLVIAKMLIFFFFVFFLFVWIMFPKMLT